jgi:hypothetical protein
MKLLRLCALLAPVALFVPLSAHAAMSSETRATYMKECVATASQNLDPKAAQAHCTCGATQIDKNFSAQEINALNNTQTPPNAELTARLQKVVAENCAQAKK